MLTQTPRSPSASGSLASIAAAARRSTLKVPIRFTRTTASNGSNECGPRRPAVFSAQPMPAQQTEIRSEPAASMASATCSAFVTSHSTKRAPSSSASAAPFSALRSAIVISAPAARSRRAVAAPSPDAPPATSALAPSILMTRDRSAGTARTPRARPRAARARRRSGSRPPSTMFGSSASPVMSGVMVRKSSSTIPAAHSAPCIVGPPSESSARTPRARRSASISVSPGTSRRTTSTGAGTSGGSPASGPV